MLQTYRCAREGLHLPPSSSVHLRSSRVHGYPYGTQCAYVTSMPRAPCCCTSVLTSIYAFLCPRPLCSVYRVSNIESFLLCCCAALHSFLYTVTPSNLFVFSYHVFADIMRPSATCFALGALLNFYGCAWAAYTLKDDYSGDKFFAMFDFFTEADPTHGYVDYISQSAAQSAGLINNNNNQIYMGVDTKNIASGRGRKSVRLTSKAVYNHGLIILDLEHMPGSVCGTWPAFVSDVPTIIHSTIEGTLFGRAELTA